MRESKVNQLLCLSKLLLYIWNLLFSGMFKLVSFNYIIIPLSNSSQNIPEPRLEVNDATVCWKQNVKGRETLQNKITTFYNILLWFWEERIQSIFVHFVDFNYSHRPPMFCVSFIGFSSKCYRLLIQHLYITFISKTNQNSILLNFFISLDMTK